MTTTPPLLLQCRLPEWLCDYYAREIVLPGLEARVRLTLELARRNLEDETGGPFAAVLFERGSGRFYAAGVNVVIPEQLSLAHAEVTALAAAQQKFGSYDLTAADLELVASCEPCAMCYGATLWSGIRALVYSAPGSAAAAIGFREGHKPADWAKASCDYGIEVTGPVLPEAGEAVLRLYAERGGVRYNAGN